jgi:DNA-binding IclR family transcriptional regulator
VHRKEDQAENGRVESVHRALVLLKLLAKEGSISVTEAARALEVNPSTAQRLLVTMVGDGFARQGEHRRYLPGRALLNLPRTAPQLREQMHPYLERLFERAGETVHLATLVGTEIHHHDGIEAVQPLRFGLRVGVRLPAHVTSGGKAMLARLPDQEVDARYRVAMLGHRGSALNVDLPALHAQLEETRRAGYASNFEESEPGVAAFGVALGPIDGEHIALTIAMPIARYSDALGESFAAILLQTAAEVREDLA